MWSEVVSLRVAHDTLLIFAGVGPRAVALTNPGPVPVRLDSGSLNILIHAGQSGALRALTDIYVQMTDDGEPQICRVQFATSGT
jgi:hypothetical protein